MDIASMARIAVNITIRASDNTDQRRTAVRYKVSSGSCVPNQGIIDTALGALVVRNVDHGSFPAVYNQL
jgi:hypothetical protein